MRPIHEMLLQAQGHARFHMPGHKGALDPFDMTELPSTDDLYHPQGAIREAERWIAQAAGAGRRHPAHRRGDRRQPYDAAVRFHALPRHPHGAHRARERGFRPGAGRYGSGRKRRGLCHPADYFGRAGALPKADLLLVDEAHGAHFTGGVRRPTPGGWARICGCSPRTRLCPRSRAAHGY